MFLVTTPMLCVGCLNLSINSLTTWRIEFRECSAQDLMAFKLHFFHNNLKMIPLLIVFLGNILSSFQNTECFRNVDKIFLAMVAWF